MIPSPTQSQVLAGLRKFLLNVLPSDVKVVLGQPNRVPEVGDSRFVVMSPPAFKRLRTNLDASEDVKFVGSIAGTVMTVTSAAPTAGLFGVVEVDATVFGVGVAANTKVVSLGTGTGGIGTYNVSVSQTVASGTLSSGAKSAEQGAEVVVQLDFHAADGTSGDMAQVVSTLLRDPYGTEFFAAQDPIVACPLYADDPVQRPFHNDQGQIEWRWALDAHLQANQVVSVPQQYADAVEVELVSVDVVYPP